jgi:hypothetical protein
MESLSQLNVPHQFRRRADCAPSCRGFFLKQREGRID